MTTGAVLSFSNLFLKTDSLNKLYIYTLTLALNFEFGKGERGILRIGGNFAKNGVFWLLTIFITGIKVVLSEIAVCMKKSAWFFLAFILLPSTSIDSPKVLGSSPLSSTSGKDFATSKRIYLNQGLLVATVLPGEAILTREIQIPSSPSRNSGSVLSQYSVLSKPKREFSSAKERTPT